MAEKKNFKKARCYSFSTVRDFSPGDLRLERGLEEEENGARISRGTGFDQRT